MRLTRLTRVDSKLNTIIKFDILSEASRNEEQSTGKNAVTLRFVGEQQHGNVQQHSCVYPQQGTLSFMVNFMLSPISGNTRCIAQWLTCVNEEREQLQPDLSPPETDAARGLNDYKTPLAP
jgi:hypothetical protein